MLIVDLHGGYVSVQRARSWRPASRWISICRRASRCRRIFPGARIWPRASRRSGLLRTNQGVMMIAAAPVLDGSGGGAALGMVLMGRLLTPEQVQMIGAQAQASLAMLPDHRRTARPDRRDRRGDPGLQALRGYLRQAADELARRGSAQDHRTRPWRRHLCLAVSDRRRGHGACCCWSPRSIASCCGPWRASPGMRSRSARARIWRRA